MSINKYRFEEKFFSGYFGKAKTVLQNKVKRQRLSYKTVIDFYTCKIVGVMLY